MEQNLLNKESSGFVQDVAGSAHYSFGNVFGFDVATCNAQQQGYPSGQGLIAQRLCPPRYMKEIKREP